MPFVRSAGADIVDDPRRPTTLTMADEGTRAALEQVLSVARDPRITPTPKQLARRDAVSRFTGGRLGMMIGTRAIVPRLRQTPSLHFDVFPLPRLGSSKTVAEMTGYCVSKDVRAHPRGRRLRGVRQRRRRARDHGRTAGAIVPANLAALRSESFMQPAKFPVDAQVFGETIRRAERCPSPWRWPTVVSQTQPLVTRLFYAAVLDLDTLLPRIDAGVGRAARQPSATPSP